MVTLWPNKIEKCVELLSHLPKQDCIVAVVGVLLLLASLLILFVYTVVSIHSVLDIPAMRLASLLLWCSGISAVWLVSLLL